MKKILVADCELVRQLVKRTFPPGDYLVLEAGDNVTALEITKKEIPELMLVAMDDSQVDGKELCRAIRDDPALIGAVIIMLTADFTDEEREKALDMEADDCIAKPFSPLVLLEVVQACLQKGGAPRGEGSEVSSPRHALTGKEADFQDYERSQLLLYADDFAKVYKEKTHELKKAGRRIKELEHIKDAFVATVSHEIRTPLSLILGYINLINELKKVHPLDNALADYISRIETASNKLDDMVKQILEFFKLRAGLVRYQKLDISIQNLLESVIDDFRRDAEAKELHLELKVLSEMNPLLASWERLNIAFSHLVRNAIIFTPAGEKVWIEACDSREGITVKVCDTGSGIHPDEQENIFSPFYQVTDFLEREVGGLGLGLPVAKHIVEDHGGTITVESSVGEGAVFTVFLPRAHVREI
ncbi:MAG: hybrid sensor histidine kinase/response regulator [Candidatus Eremiobacteraeota bacterium]|nr:hybrid sensor histidine kinase/response regulator [Candidatus Eremiobacteraeota bacterium]